MKQSVRILRRFTAGTITATVMMITVSPTIAQTADEVWGLHQRDMSVGARMTGMSIRGFAGFGDYSAMYGNPAGLGYVDGNKLVISLRGFDAINDSKILAGGFDRDVVSTSMDNTGLGNLAFLYDVPVARGKLVGGLALSQTRDFSRGLNFVGENVESTISTSFLPFDNEYSINQDGDLGELADLPFAAFNGGIFEYFRELHEQGEYPFYSTVVPGTLIEQSVLVSESGEAYELNAGLAWQATKDIMVGASVNIFVGDYRFDYNFTESDILNENTADQYNVLLDDGTLLEGFNELDYQQTLSSDMAGINLRAGMSGNLRDRIRFGVTLESPTWSYFEESYGEQFTTRFDLGGSVTYGDHADDIGNGFFEYSVRSPWRLGVGLRLDGGIAMLTGEAEVIDWTQLRLSSSEGAEVFSEVNRVIDSEYGVALNYALGTEFEIGFVDLRWGLAFRSSPYKDPAAVSPPDGRQIGDRFGMSFGAGLQLTDGIRVDLGLHTEEERDVWDLYPSDDAGPRQDSRFEIDEMLTRRSAVLQLTVKL
ncbi:MAG: hypothetical protein F4065_04165 [Rhodothermaceae bacterium]|nr:hypothetical protein [Rhodothermaceae bacterium]MXZ58856.1 hypothetical protein [Rhodothermaceae bacterium]MYB91585.1 hypothetical protein [Rhodothermaceae bacterium]MYD67358.1 hypothetical protein [Rhodothermaceae bacterium]MYG44683.1 hypothetical protein [Rhodothermaceae bacterium]